VGLADLLYGVGLNLLRAVVAVALVIGLALVNAASQKPRHALERGSTHPIRSFGRRGVRSGSPSSTT
jgi:hypothetical protein